ncbi:MAG: hypothetical protein EOP63_09680 [Sphingomonadales bacterium]|nr:MAG: hypothetical protein EOP63_09680 [Sphingomonadales bacterium]
MTIDNALLWQTVLAADYEYGETAETHALTDAARAAAGGDAAQAALWQAAAEALQTLYQINCNATRLRRPRRPMAPERQ